MSLKAAEEKVRAQQDQLAATANELAEQEQAATDRLAEAQSILGPPQRGGASPHSGHRRGQEAGPTRGSAASGGRAGSPSCRRGRCGPARSGGRATTSGGGSSAGAGRSAGQGTGGCSGAGRLGSSSTEGDAAPAGDPQPPAADSGAPSDAGNNNGPTSGDSSLPTPVHPSWVTASTRHQLRPVPSRQSVRLGSRRARQL